MIVRLVVFLLTIGTLFSQNKTITGVVLNGDEPVAFTSVNFKGDTTSFDGYTDANGKFSLQMPYGTYEVSTSAVGLKTTNKSIVISESNAGNLTILLAEDYYAVRFNVETNDTIVFGGKTFVNKNSGKRRLAYHEIPELLAGREKRSLELPATVILDENSEITDRYSRYIPPKEMLSILKN